MRMQVPLNPTIAIRAREIRASAPGPVRARLLSKISLAMGGGASTRPFKFMNFS